MKDSPEGFTNDLSAWFGETVSMAVQQHIATSGQPDVEQYLTNMLVNFVRTDAIFSLKDNMGRQLVAISDMLREGDVLENADSFEREREVHRHIGDFILFWSGLYPKFLDQLRFHVETRWIADYNRQAKESYYLVSTFTKPPFDDEAPVFRKLSEGFDDYAFCLRVIGDRLAPR